MSLKDKDLISIHDLSVGEVATILEVARKLKRMQKKGVPHEYLRGKTLAMLFSKASTRTRVSFEVGFHQLGGHALYLNDAVTQLGRGEPVCDTARVLSRFVDGIMIRTFSHDSVIELAEYADVPVINGLTDLLHPCQALTDMFTIQEKMKVLKGRKLVYVGDGNNMAHSLMFACAKVGMNMICASPKGYQPNPTILAQAQEDALQTGCSITVEEDLFHAAKDADVLYTDVCSEVWVRRLNARFASKHCIIIRLILSCWLRRVLRLLFCIVCLRTVVKKLLKRFLKDRSQLFLTKQKIDCMYRRQLWRCL